MEKYKSNLQMSKSMGAMDASHYSVPNPLDSFPSKNDSLGKAVFGFGGSKKRSKLAESAEKWLSPTKIDPNFGVHGNSDEVRLQRTFRRLQSSNLFNPVKYGDETLKDLSKIPAHNKKFVIVEESKLAELTKLETMLRKEKELIGEQCSWVLSDFQFDARIPVPAVRLAVGNLCKQQMERVAADIRALISQWSVFAKQNHYEKPHLFLKESFLKCAPPSQRALKLRMVREAADTWRQRKDRDTMLFEDDLSALNALYLDAKGRKRDYDRYFILASRYGVYSEAEFNLDPRPGKRYYIAVTDAALKFQHLWDRYWAMTRLRRFKSAKKIQRLWRMQFHFKRLHPLILIRMRIGKKTYYRFCWQLWLEYNRICKRIKEALRHQFSSWNDRCFQYWRKFVKMSKAEKEARLLNIINRVKNSNLYNKFLRIRHFAYKTIECRRRLKRLFHHPHFQLWVQYTHWSKYVKKLHRSSTTILKEVRRFLILRKFRRKKKAKISLAGFYRMIMAFRKTKAIRDGLIAEGMREWGPAEKTRRITKANENERMRLTRRQFVVQEKEKEAVADLQDHFKTRDGYTQLVEYVTFLENSNDHPSYNNKDFKALSKQDKIQKAKEEMIKKCSEVNRNIEIHDFTTRLPPFVRCVNPACGATFTSEEQYHNHVAVSVVHKEDICMPCDQSDDEVSELSFTFFHLMLRHKKGQDILRQYLLQFYGISGLVNDLDYWIAVQDWKKTGTVQKQYNTKAMQIFELHLVDDAPRKVDVTVDNIHEMVADYTAVKLRENKGFYKLAVATPNLLRKLIGWSGREYEAWTAEQVLSPIIFDEVEWKCFQAMYKIISNDKKFLSSEAYKEFCAARTAEAKQREIEFIADYKFQRMQKFVLWVKDFKNMETTMFDMAGKVADMVLELEIERLSTRFLKFGVKEQVKNMAMGEQAKHEPQVMFEDEIVSFAEENVLEFVYQHYVTSMLNAMLLVPALTKGMMEYAGMVKVTLKKKMVIEKYNAKVDNEANEWFRRMLKDISEADKATNTRPRLPKSPEEATQSLQKIARGMIARNRVRKIFIATYIKKMDVDTRKPYYVNVKDGTSAWERPKFMKHLYPNTNW